MTAAAFRFPEIPEWPRPAISKSRINTYRTCPARFGFEYVARRAHEIDAAAEIFGRAMHQAVALYYRGRQQGVTPCLQEIAAEFAFAWESGVAGATAPLRYADGYDFHSMGALGRALLEVFLRDVRPRRILAVEQRFAVALGNTMLIGILDLVEADQDGDPIIVELKTACGRMSDRQADLQLDARVYAYALDQLGLRTSDESTLVRYDVLIKRRRPALSTTYSPQPAEKIRSFASWVQPVLEGIRRERFYPKKGWYCAYCPFQRACQQKQSCSLPSNRQSLAGSGVSSINPAFVHATRAVAGVTAAAASEGRRP